MRIETSFVTSSGINVSLSTLSESAERSSRKSPTTTMASSSASLSAIARPMPRLPPVTMATLIADYPRIPPAAIYWNSNPGDVPGFLAREEQRQTCDFLRSRHATLGYGIDVPLEDLVDANRLAVGRHKHGRINGARADGIDADLLFGVIERHGACQQNDRALRCTIGSQPGTANQPPHSRLC